MRADRLLSLLLLLQVRGRTTAAALAAELGVSPRTVYRDLDALDGAGVPVRTESGPGGGCELLEGFRTPLTGLSADEAAALLAVGVPGPLEDLGLGRQAAGALDKVFAALPAAARASAGRRRFHLDAPAWFRAREPAPLLPALARAVREDRRARICHRSTGREARWRVVEPLGLVAKAGLWYLVAVAGRHVAVYRASRVLAVEALPDTFRRPPDFDLADFWDGWTAAFESSRPRLPVSMRVSRRVAGALPEVMGDGVRRLIEEAGAVDAGGWLNLTLDFESATAAAHTLAGFGDGIEVLAPEDVRQRLVETARRTLRLYRGAT
jgi:predicted DNA-binding transcriptional regulator YafY